MLGVQAEPARTGPAQAAQPEEPQHQDHGRKHDRARPALARGAKKAGRGHQEREEDDEHVRPHSAGDAIQDGGRDRMARVAAGQRAHGEGGEGDRRRQHPVVLRHHPREGDVTRPQGQKEGGHHAHAEAEDAAPQHEGQERGEAGQDRGRVAGDVENGTGHDAQHHRQAHREPGPEVHPAARPGGQGPLGEFLRERDLGLEVEELTMRERGDEGKPGREGEDGETQQPGRLVSTRRGTLRDGIRIQAGWPGRA